MAEDLEELRNGKGRLAMVLPRWLARFNRSITNRILIRIPKSISPFVSVHHRGRKTGSSYMALLVAFPTSDGYVLTPTYGPDADWVRNVLAAESFSLERKGHTHSLTRARLITRTEAWPYLPGFVRLAMRILRVKWFVRADVA